MEGNLRTPTIDEVLSDFCDDFSYGALQAKPFPNEHAARLKAPGAYKRFRRENDKFGSGVHAIWGIRKDDDVVELQAIRFSKSKFTTAQARKWLKDHDYEPILFEPASGKKVYESPGGADKDREGESTMKTAAGAEKAAGTAPAGGGDVAAPDSTNRELSRSAQYKRPLLAEKSFVQMKRASPTSKSGGIEGYLSAFDVVDHQGEVVRRGAFLKTIQERGEAGKIPLMVVHFASGGDILDCVGSFSELKEDDYGLRFSANFHGDKRSQEVREKVKVLLKDGVSLGSSIGYRPVAWKYMTMPETNQRITELTEIALVEGTITLKPANEGARITGAKDFVPSTTALAAVMDADASSMSPDERGRVIDEAFGDRERAEAARKDLTSLLAKIGGLLSQEPLDADGKAGGDTPTKPTVDLHSVSVRIASMKAAVMRTKAAAHRG